MSDYDIIFILPYSFTDHPSFPEGILKRILEINGFKVGVIERPFWQDKHSFAVLGRPKLFFAVISGPMDSMVLNFTSSKKRRKEDLYQIDGNSFFKGYPPSIKYKIRPDRTLIVLTNKIRESFKDIPVIIGGLEASLRCFAHYDFLSNEIRRSILFDSRADILVCGNGEKQIVNISNAVKKSKSSDQLYSIDFPGTAAIKDTIPESKNIVILPSFEEVTSDSSKFFEMQMMIEKAKLEGKGIAQRYSSKYIVENPPEIYHPEDVDLIYNLKFTRRHLNERFYSPACRMNLFSITSHKGCSGGCSFCSINAHEGKRICSRSIESIIKEASDLRKHPEWKGYISDVGGASAEMYGNDCGIKKCLKPSCIYPRRCEKFGTASRYLELLRELRKIKGIKKVFLGSGVRYDLLLNNTQLLEEILVYHSGRFLRIAPEHTQDKVLELMRKPSFKVFNDFVNIFNLINKKLKRKIELSPYLMIGHPGETLEDIKEMKVKLKSLNLKPESVQIFTPTPGTLSTAMYYSGFSYTFKPINVEKDINSLLRRKTLLF